MSAPRRDPHRGIQSYQPYWALAAHLLDGMQESEKAVAAYSRAIGLSEDPAVREFLTQRTQR